MNPLTILFTYYQDDEVTRDHFERLRTLNPGIPIVPLFDGACEFLPGTLDVSRCRWGWGENRDPWYNIDTFAYRFFRELRTHKTDAERYLMVESDTLATASMREVFADVWSADIAVTRIATIEKHPGWYWFVTPTNDERFELYNSHRQGLLPSGVVLYSRRALNVLSRVPTGGFAELRLGTLAKAYGLNVVEVPDHQGRVECAAQDLTADPRKPHLYHPVKTKTEQGRFLNV